MSLVSVTDSNIPSGSFNDAPLPFNIPSSNLSATASAILLRIYSAVPATESSNAALHTKPNLPYQ